MAVTGYSRAQITLHWLVALLVIAQFVLHEGMVDSFRTKIDTGVSNFTPMTVLHIAGGIAILAFALLRLQMRRSRGVPLPPAEDGAVQKLVAKLVHGGIYALLILLPVTGVVAWAGPSGLAGGIHGALRIVLFFLVALHVAGALYGQFVQKTGVIRRMMKAAD
jgi:cytochrome b561